MPPHPDPPQDGPLPTRSLRRHPLLPQALATQRHEEGCHQRIQRRGQQRGYHYSRRQRRRHGRTPHADAQVLLPPARRQPRGHLGDATVARRRLPLRRRRAPGVLFEMLRRRRRNRHRRVRG